MTTEEHLAIYKVADGYREEMRAGFFASTGKEMPRADVVLVYGHILNFLYWLMEKEREAKEQKKNEQLAKVD